MNYTLTGRAHSEQPPARRLVGDKDVWLFIFGELFMFSAFFLSYITYRAQDVNLYLASQAMLDQHMGALNTVLLVTSSWLVAMAVSAARRNQQALISRYLALGIVFGLCFLVVKYFEYSAKFSLGINMLTNEFFMFYFVLTMVHAFHVAGGAIILFVMWKKARAGGYDSSNMHGLETGAAYWHMVDLLWLVMFPLLYLLR